MRGWVDGIEPSSGIPAARACARVLPAGIALGALIRAHRRREQALAPPLRGERLARFVEPGGEASEIGGAERSRLGDQPTLVRLAGQVGEELHRPNGGHHAVIDTHRSYAHGNARSLSV